jgi:hypothetical protein
MGSDKRATVAVDEAALRALLRLAVAAGALGNALHSDPNCGCESCELVRAWRLFAANPDVAIFLDSKLAVEAASRLLNTR